MSPVRSRRSFVPAARLVPLAALPALAACVLAFALAGCGGGAVDTAPSAQVPPATPSSGGTELPGTPVAPQGEGDKLATGWKYRFDMVSPANDNDAITTRELYLYFRADTIAVHFQAENRLGVPIKILWDESTFLDVNGRMWKALHRGATYSTRDLPQEPTYLQPGQRYADFVIPVDLLNDPEAAAGQGGRKLLPTDLSAQSLIGKTFGPNLTFEVENAGRQTFEVRFKVVSAYQDR